MNHLALQALSSDQEPIIALCTPRGSGAIALLRLSGSHAIEIADAMGRLASGKKLSDSPSHTIHFGSLVNPDGTTIDEILFLLMKGPKTFTGQDTIEFTCHNNQFIIEHVIACACAHGARLARAGEFSKRSFLNGKLDLIQVEAINDIIHAQTEEALRRSMQQLQGSLSYHLADVQDQLLKLLALTEASFEFLEEEQRDFDMQAHITTALAHLHTTLTTLQEEFAHQNTLRQGVTVCLIGKVNAGKSTLFNALVKKERAIVSPIAGTTRDSIETNLYKNGIFWTFVDTAGLRTTHDTIEQQGIDRSHAQAEISDVVLIVIDTSTPLSEQEADIYKTLLQKHAHKALMVLTKHDITHPHFSLSALEQTNSQTLPPLYVCAQTKRGIPELEAMIDTKIQALFAHLNAPFLLTQRQATLINEIEKIVDFIEKKFIHTVEYELVAYHLMQALEKIAELTGKNIHEKMLDEVFGGFCVGK
ncbi:MAG: tRNA modification GTPase MnmE [candidate division TM6 bacterium GW2011_GWF2_38_10]|nr:MAG: tRNA modification GTPase MnmE [candidate division TM6 bacterium GW2011_GWF2_38_10]